MKRLLMLAIAVVAAGVLLVVLPLGAGASSDKRFVLAIQGAFTGESTGEGTFSVAGAISDSGTVDVTFDVMPGRGDCIGVSGDETFTTPNGSFMFAFTGRACSPSPDDPRSIFDARFTITGGTGAYAGISGRGKVTGENDFTDFTFTSIYDGNVHFPQ
jgi:hypothetical protein